MSHIGVISVGGFSMATTNVYFGPHLVCILIFIRFQILGLFSLVGMVRLVSSDMVIINHIILLLKFPTLLTTMLNRWHVVCAIHLSY